MLIVVFVGLPTIIGAVSGFISVPRSGEQLRTKGRWCWFAGITLIFLPGYAQHLAITAVSIAKWLGLGGWILLGFGTFFVTRGVILDHRYREILRTKHSVDPSR